MQWSETDDLVVGHGSDEKEVYRELSRLVAAEIAESQQSQRALPKKYALITMPVAV